jgi:hypothetical protein
MTPAERLRRAMLDISLACDTIGSQPATIVFPTFIDYLNARGLLPAHAQEAGLYCGIPIGYDKTPLPAKSAFVDQEIGA